MAFLLFEDQSLEVHNFFASLCQRSGSSLLVRAFIDKVGVALRDEVDKLSAGAQSDIPRFRTLQQLNEKHHGATIKHNGVANALLVVTQLAHYIERVEVSFGDGMPSKDTYLVGIGIGLFSAAAVSCASSPTTLIPLGVQVVLMAFRLGCYAASTAHHLCLKQDVSQSWTSSFPDITLQKGKARLDEFHLLHGITSSCQAYISAVLLNGLHISGPPSILKQIAQEDLFESQPTMLPSYSPYQASHIHHQADISTLLKLQSGLLDGMADISVRRIPVISGNGSRLPQSDVASLFMAVGQECLNMPVFMRSVVDRCVEAARSFEGPECVLLSYGPPNLASELAKAIAKDTELDVVVKTTLSSPTNCLGNGIGTHGSSGKCKLAIVGMSGRFPDAASHEALWDLLCKGIDAHRVVPKDRFSVDTHVDLTGKAINTSHTPYGCFIEQPGLFDPRFFNMSPREAFQTDPMQRLAITTAYEALEMSGYVPNRTSSTRLDRIGTFYGQTSDDWREINAAQEIDTYFITGGVRAFGPGRINYCFGFSGPSLNIDTACSSSAAALQVACSSLWAKECDTAVVGGLSVLGNPDIFSGLSRGQFLSKNGPCATFDNAADGYCRADGCASVIVKRLDDAIADRDNILAVVLGTATNHSADAISITHPHGPTQSTLSTAILDEAGVDPLDVDYVEMHGTGTQAGDGTEMVSVTNVFAPADRKRSTDRPLYLGAVKANVGHGEAASGVTALCKVLMMFQKNIIPPHVGIKKGSIINVTFPKDLSERNVNIPFDMTPFKRNDGRPRRVFVNNFSAAGGNTGLLLEDAPAHAQLQADPRGSHVITITGKSKSAMMRNAENLKVWMATNPSASLADVAYTTTARRIQHYWRMNIIAGTLSEAQVAIDSRLKGSFSPVSVSDRSSVAFVFTGQGSQYEGMGKDLYWNHSVFRENIDAFESLALIHGFPSFVGVIDGTEDDLSKLSPVVMQLALCCLEMALVRLWASWAIVPDVVLGHSLGEYAALYASGAVSASDTIYLVGKRAELLVEACTPGTHSMLAIQGSVANLRETLGDDDLNVACINGPMETVISGEVANMAKTADKLDQKGIRCTQLKVPFAFHSVQVEPMLDSFEKIAHSIKFQTPQIPLISPSLGKVVRDEILDAKYLRNHARDCVDFLGGLVSARSENVITEKTIWLEIGPHSVCSNKVKATFGSSTMTATSLRRKEETYKTLGNSLCVFHSAGLDLDWNEYHRDFPKSTQLLDLPAYSFDNKNYWIQYEGDWCLTKNMAATVPPPTAAIEPPKPKLSTTSVHDIIKEEVDDDVCLVETETNLSRDDIRQVLTGHLCNGVPLCPSTLYADIAMTIADYAYKLIRPGTEVGLNVADMSVPKTLIFDESVAAHVLRSTVKVNAIHGYADITFCTGEGAKRTEHAMCKVRFGDIDDWRVEFERTNYLIKSRIDSLIKAEQEGSASKIGRGLAYKLFSALVDYDKKFQGMEEVILDSRTMEATAKVTFQTTEADGDFFFSPYWIDSCCHISGFIVNGTDAIDSREQVFISHGWGSIRFIEKPVAEKSYRSYIRMQPVKGTKMMAGDAYVFDGERIIGVAGDVRFQSIPRKVLNAVLPPRGSVSSGTKTKLSPISTPSQTATAMKNTSKKERKQTGTPTVQVPEAKPLKSVVASFLEILTKEVGCDPDELADNIAFADLGCDSLMALTVSGRMREELDVNIDSQAFLEHSTIGAFKVYLAQFEAIGTSTPSSRIAPVFDESSGVSSGSESDASSLEYDSGTTTPLYDSDKDPLKDSGTQKTLRGIIANEMGVDVDEIIAAPDLAAMGMDSLMALTISGLLREELGIEIPSDLFVVNASLAEVERALGISNVSQQVSSAAVRAEKRSQRQSKTALAKPANRVINTHPGNTTARIQKPPPPTEIVDHYPHRKATSVLLQGSVRTATRSVFMVPDGGGCATSYTEIGPVSPEWAVWGMFSPFMKTPEEMTCGVYGMAAKFIQEMKRRQPAGPYHLAGWSAGGVIAFEMTNQLVGNGESVENLILIDAPCPIIVEPLDKSIHQWFASIGLLGEGDDEGSAKKIPSWLLPHFASSIVALSSYTAVPIPGEKCPKVMAIWCEDGVCKTPDDPRPEPYPTGHALFLLDNRYDFGPNRWDEYLEPEKIQTRHMPGNHFTMMHGDKAKQLGGFIREALLE